MKTKSTDNNLLFFQFCLMTQSTKTKQNKQTNSSTQRNYENSLLVADRVSKYMIRNSHPI